MKRKLMASVLLASMALSMPVFADDDRTPDEYNPNAKYESPLNRPTDSIVNDYQKARIEEENESFAQAAGLLTQDVASGKNTIEQNSSATRVDSTGKTLVEGETKEERRSNKASLAPEKQAALKKAEKQAEKLLLETDEDFEPVPGKEYPGYEYQARKQVPDTETTKTFSDNNGLQQGGTNSVRTPLKKESSVISTTIDDTNKKRKEKKNTVNLPLIITGDDAQYASESGDFVIEGNVRLQQGITLIMSTKAVGNAKTGDIWLLEGGTLQEPANRMQTRWAHYNFNKGTGELLHLKGASSPKPGSGKYDFYEAPHGIVENGVLIIDQGGMTTRCPAVHHHPCLSVKAKKITIIPDDRIIARGVQVFVKGKHIYSRDVWINNLAQESKNKIMPRMGWKSDKGFYVSLDYEHPIGNPLLKNPTTFSMHQVYYTKSKYKPFYSIRHDEHDFYVRVNSGYVYDSDNDALDEGVWLHKKIDWGLFLKPHRIVKGLPLTYDASITHGLWKYNNESWSSWRTEKVINLRHDRIYPLGGKKLYLDLMVGRKWVKNSLNNATTKIYGKNLNSNIYNGTLGYAFSEKWNTWVSYHNEHRTDYLFSLGQPSFSKAWFTGVSWRPDAHNTFTIVNQHNLESGSPTHGNYSTVFAWSHKFCCEILSVAYENKHYNHDKTWTVKFDFFNW